MIKLHKFIVWNVRVKKLIKFVDVIVEYIYYFRTGEIHRQVRYLFFGGITFKS